MQKFAKIALVVLCAIGASADHSDTNPCVGKADGVFLPDPSSCTKYITCLGGLHYHAECPEYTYFRPNGDNGKGSCYFGECDVECPETGIVNVPIPGNCSSYSLCINGESNIINCPAPYLFDATNGVCIKPDPKLEQCVTNRCDELVLFEDEFLCGRYYICLKGSPVAQNCPPTLHYDPESNLCVVAAAAPSPLPADLPPICMNDSDEVVSRGYLVKLA